MTKKQEKILILLCWLVYTCAYFGRYSYTANIVPITDYYGATNTEVSLATTFFFFSYGAGQIINGLLCKHYNMKFMLCGALIVSSVINLAVYLGIPFTYIKYLWIVNGLSQSVLWSSLMLVLSKNLDQKYLKTAVVVMSTTTSVGTFLTYGLSSLLAVWNGFKLSFLIATVAMTAVALIWFFSHDKVTDYSQGVSDVKQQNEETASSVFDSKKSWFVALVKCVALFGVFAIIINFIKDGLSTWVPKVLKDDYGLGDSLSILLTLVLPVFGVIGTVFATALSKRIKEFSTILGLLFVLSSIGLAGVIGLFSTTLWVIVLILFGLVYMFMAGANATLTTTIPLYYRDKFNSGLTSGLINGSCYIGSSLSSIIIGLIADAGGGSWLPVFYVLLALCAIPILLSLACSVFRRVVAKKSCVKDAE